MEYFAETKKLTKILNNPRLIQRYYGKNMMKKILARLDEFDAAENLQQIPSDPPPRCHPLHGKLEGKFAVDVSGNYRIVFEGYDRNDELSMEKEKIVTIQITDIEDYH